MHTLRCQLPRPEKLSHLVSGLGLKGLRKSVCNNFSQLALDLFGREGQSSHSSPWHTASHTDVCQGALWASSTTAWGNGVVASILRSRTMLRCPRKNLIPFDKWHSHCSAEDFDKTLTAECSIHPSASAGRMQCSQEASKVIETPTQPPLALIMPNLRLPASLRFARESQMNLKLKIQSEISLRLKHVDFTP